MKTGKLFYEDAYRRTGSGTVRGIRRDGDGVWVSLDRTVFYPEGGGQPSDTGRLTWRAGEGTVCAAVAAVREEDGEIWHLLEEDGTDSVPVPGEGTPAEEKIDWERRLDLMQQHTGEHIVSGLIHRRFEYDNVGFHLTEESMTVDLSGPLTWAELTEIEAEANRVIRSDLPVEITWPEEKERERIPYRSKKELSGEVRIVTVPGADICACCGTHVSRTGEIGSVKLTAMQKWKSGVRVWLCCGARAEAYCRMLQEQNHEISTALSAKPQETAAAVRKLAEELTLAREELTAWKYRVYAEMAERFRDKGDIVLFEAQMETGDLRRLADRLKEVCGGYCLVLSGNDREGYRYVLGRKTGDVRPLAETLNRALSGRGGGRAEMVQGTFAAERARIEACAREQFAPAG